MTSRIPSQQVQLAMTSSIILSSSVSGGALHLLHMPFSSSATSPPCCGLLELVYSQSKHSRPVAGQHGHQHVARSMRAFYKSVDIAQSVKINIESNSPVDISSISKLIDESIRGLVKDILYNVQDKRSLIT